MRTLMLTTGIIFGLSGAAFAQYSGPSETKDDSKDAYETATIADIMADPKDGMHVTLEGMLVRKMSDEMYVLSDGTNEINVEIDEDDFPNSEVSETTKVKIEGEVDTHLTRDADIEADRVEIMQ